jgi:hypothetical protein
MSEFDDPNEIRELEVEFNLKIKEKIGMGAFASVFRSVDVDSGIEYAVKVK